MNASALNAVTGEVEHTESVKRSDLRFDYFSRLLEKFGWHCNPIVFVHPLEILPPTLVHIEWDACGVEFLAQTHTSLLVLASPHAFWLAQINVGLRLGKFRNQIHGTVGTVGKTWAVFGFARGTKHMEYAPVYYNQRR
jgi:hypothetical protein